MINTIDEYLNLANSDNPIDNNKTKTEDLSLDVAMAIINDHPKRKSWLVHNKCISGEILQLLSVDEDVDVRFTVAMKKKCGRNIFKTLMNDSDFSVRLATIRNNKFPIDLLETMSNDNDIEISSEAKRILNERISQTH